MRLIVEVGPEVNLGQNPAMIFGVNLRITPGFSLGIRSTMEPRV